ncbi:hypothetical protein KCU88_g252, partial [Aureobasidium melanogenum]
MSLVYLERVIEVVAHLFVFWDLLCFFVLCGHFSSRILTMDSMGVKGALLMPDMQSTNSASILRLLQLDRQLLSLIERRDPFRELCLDSAIPRLFCCNLNSANPEQQNPNSPLKSLRPVHEALNAAQILKRHHHPVDLDRISQTFLHRAHLRNQRASLAQRESHILNRRNGRIVKIQRILRRRGSHWTRIPESRSSQDLNHRWAQQGRVKLV